MDKQLVAEAFAAHAVEALYSTSDDQLFFSEHDARNHARSLPDKSIVQCERDGSVQDVKDADRVREIVQDDPLKNVGGVDAAMKAAHELHAKRLKVLLLMGAKVEGDWIKLGDRASASLSPALANMDDEEWRDFLAQWRETCVALRKENKPEKGGEDATASETANASGSTEPGAQSGGGGGEGGSDAAGNRPAASRAFQLDTKGTGKGADKGDK